MARPPAAPTDWHPHAMQLFRHNMLVLALHAAACLAGFIVHTALTDPLEGAALLRSSV